MNRNPADSPTDFDPLDGALRETVEQMRVMAVPEDSLSRALGRATALRLPSPAWTRRLTARLCAACLALVLVGTLVVVGWMNWPTPDDAPADDPAPVAVAPQPIEPPRTQDPRPAPLPTPPPQPAPAPVNPLHENLPMIAKLGTMSSNDGLNNFNRFGTNPSGVPGMTMSGLSAGTSPAPFMAVAADAPVIVTTGRAKPIRLGEQVPYNATKDTTLHVWDWHKSNESRPIALAKPPGAMAVTPDGKWIVMRDGRLIDAAEGSVKQLDNFDGEVHGMLFAPDGRTLLLTVRRPNNVSSARVLDFPSAKKRCEIDGQWWYTFAGAFTPDGREFLLMDKDRFVCRYDAVTGKRLTRYEPAFTNSIRAIAVAADGKQVAAAASAPVDTQLWEVASGKLLRKLPPKQKHAVYSEIGIAALAFAPDGKLLAGAGAYSVVLWNTGDGTVARLLPAASGNARRLRFSADGKTLTSIHDFAGVGMKRTENVLMYPAVRMWDVATGEARKADR